MNKSERFNSMQAGMLTGLILPVLVFVIVYLVLNNELSLAAYFKRIINRDVISHFISLCVFPNVFAFLIFNRLDKLYSSRGVLGITIIWALAVFLIKMI